MTARLRWKLVAAIALSALLLVGVPVVWFLAYVNKIDKLVADLGSPDYATRERAEDALGSVRSPLGIKRIAQHLGDLPARVNRGEFALVFAMIGEDAVEPLMAAEEHSSSEPWFAAPVIPAFIRVQLDEYIENSHARRRVLGDTLPQMFQYMGKPAAKRMSAALASGDARVRVFAVSALGSVTDVDTIPLLIDALGNSDVEVKRVAWWALRRLHETPKPRVIAGLNSTEIGLLADRLGDKDAASRWTAATYLEESDNPQAAEEFAALLASPNMDTRILGARGLAVRGDRRALPVLFEAMKERDRDHWGFGIGVFGRYDDAETVSLLVSGLDDPTGSTRQSAAWGLAQIIARKDASAAAKDTADKALLEAITSGVELKRRVALSALSYIKDERAIEPLKEDLRSGNESTRVSAIFSLANYDRGDTVAAIAGMLSDKDMGTRSNVVFELGTSTDPGARDALMSALKDSDAGVRDLAARLLLLRRSLDAARKNGARIEDE